MRRIVGRFPIPNLEIPLGPLAASQYNLGLNIMLGSRWVFVIVSNLLRAAIYLPSMRLSNTGSSAEVY